MQIITLNLTDGNLVSNTSERTQSSEVKSFETWIIVSEPGNWFSVCYLQSPLSASLSILLSLISVSLLFSLLILTSLSHPLGLSLLIRCIGSMKNMVMLIFFVRSLLYRAHACLRAQSSFCLLASLPRRLPPLLPAILPVGGHAPAGFNEP